MTARDTARAHRAEEKRRIAHLVTIARASFEVSQRDLAEAAGVSRALVTHWEDPEHLASPGLPDVATIARTLPELARHLLEAVAEGMDLALVDAGGGESLADDFGAMGEVLTAAGSLATHHAAACADHVLDAAEAAEGLPLAHRAKQAAAQLERRYRGVLRERVVPVLRAVPSDEVAS